MRVGGCNFGEAMSGIEFDFCLFVGVRVRDALAVLAYVQRMYWLSMA